MHDPMRQTGRTTRMLQNAMKASRAGRYVIVVAANQREADRLSDEISKAEDAKGVTGRKFYFSDSGSLSVLTLQESLNPGRHPSVVELYDHFCTDRWLSQNAPQFVLDEIDARFRKGENP